MATPPTPPPAIDTLSPTPNRATDKAPEFSNKTDTFLNELDPFGSQQNTLAEWSEDTAQEVYDNAGEAAQSATDAEDFKDQAASSAALSQGAANFKGFWGDLTGALNTPATVYHDSSYWQLLTNLADVTASEPSLTNGNWLFYSGTRWLPKITATTALAKNAQYVVEAVGGAVDVTLPSMEIGDFIVINVSSASDSQVTVINNGFTIYADNILTTADDGPMENGNTIHLVCTDTNVLRAV